MKNADKLACEIIKYPDDVKYSENIRRFQGCPTIAVTAKGRIFAGWCAGGTGEPQLENYVLLKYSDDLGKTWSQEVLVIPSSYENMVQALDIQLWSAPDGTLRIFWVQNNVVKEPEKLPEYPKWQIGVTHGGYLFEDFQHAEWEMICEQPDAEKLTFSPPRFIFHGFMRCKPIVMKNGEWLYSVYDQINPCFQYYITTDGGKTFTHFNGGKKILSWCDEPMTYQLKDGSLRTLARRKPYLTETISYDNGRTWTIPAESVIPNPEARVFVSVTPSGRVILIANNSSETREKMTVYLSEDDGKTWKYSKCIDARNMTSYPDADFFDNKIYLIYDCERTGAKELLFAEFTEEDVICDDHCITPRIISKP